MGFQVEYKESGKFVLAPSGMFQAVCCEVLDLGYSEKTYKGDDGVEQKRNVKEIQYVFQLNKVDDATGKRYEVRSRPLNLNLSDRATLRDFIRQWRGHDLTDAEKLPPGVDVDFTGKNAMLNVIHNKVGDKTYANIASITPLMEGLAQIQALNYESHQEQVNKAKAAGATGSGQSATQQAAPQTDAVGGNDPIPF